MTTQLQLIEGAAPPRPKRKTVETARRVAELLLPKVVAWLGRDHDGDDERVVCGLVKALEDTWDWDGFKLTMALDWDGDSQLVEILDMASFHQSDLYRAAVRAWVVEWNIQPQLKAGDALKVPRVLCHRHDGAVPEGDVFDGTITSIDAKEAIYTINIPAMGHNPPGCREPGTLGICLAFEEIDGKEKP